MRRRPWRRVWISSRCCVAARGLCRRSRSPRRWAQRRRDLPNAYASSEAGTTSWQVDDSYTMTTKLFELAHINPPTHRLLLEAMPLMQQLSSELDQSCATDCLQQGRQLLMAKVDAPSGMGFSVRVGAELDVLVFGVRAGPAGIPEPGNTETARSRKPSSASRSGATRVSSARSSGQRARFASIKSVQLRGCYGGGLPDPGHAGSRHRSTDGALRERIDQRKRKRSRGAEGARRAAHTLTARIGGAGPQDLSG